MGTGHSKGAHPWPRGQGHTGIADGDGQTDRQQASLGVSPHTSGNKRNPQGRRCPQHLGFPITSTHLPYSRGPNRGGQSREAGT